VRNAVSTCAVDSRSGRGNLCGDGVTVYLFACWTLSAGVDDVATIFFGLRRRFAWDSILSAFCVSCVDGG